MNKIQAGDFIKIMVAIGLIGLIGYNLGQKVIGPQIKKLNIGVTPTMTPVISSEDLTKNWLTYSDSRGFSFRYPPDYQVRKLDFGEGIAVEKTGEVYRSVDFGITEGIKLAEIKNGEKISIGGREAVWVVESYRDIFWIPFPDGRRVLVAGKAVEDKGGDNTLFRIIDSIRF